MGESDVDEALTEDDDTPAGVHGRLAGLRAFCTVHPLVVVAIVSGLGALGSALWIWTHRHPGGYDPDEAGYLATALRFHRNAGPIDPIGLLREAGRTSHGPLVPLLSQPLLWVGPRDPRTAMLIQPLLLMSTSISVAAITRRLAGPWTAIVVGCTVAGVPTMVEVSVTYWYGLGSAACTAAALWALLASDGLTNRRSWLFGLLLGLVPLSRTMALGYVPALVGAGVVMAWGDRRRLRRLAGAVLVAIAVAAPWWIARSSEIFDYLLSYGYGERAGLWGSGGPLERAWFRLGRLADYSFLVGPWFVVALAGAVAGGVTVLRQGTGDEPWSDRRREGLALLVVCVGGFVALISTTNQGVWFELPLLVAAFPLGAALVAVAPRLLRYPLAAWAIAMCVGSPIVVRLVDDGRFGPGIAQYDARFGAAEPDRHRQAEREWALLSDEVAATLAEVTERGDRGVAYVTGNTFLFNSNSLELAAELDGWGPGVGVPDTAGDSDGRQALEVIESNGAPAALVVARHDRRLFTPDAGWRELESSARDAGWEELARWPMPSGGEVVVLEPPDDAAVGG